MGEGIVIFCSLNYPSYSTNFYLADFSKIQERNRCNWQCFSKAISVGMCSTCLCVMLKSKDESVEYRTNIIMIIINNFQLQIVEILHLPSLLCYFLNYQVYNAHKHVIIILSLSLYTYMYVSHSLHFTGKDSQTWSRGYNSSDNWHFNKLMMFELIGTLKGETK